MILKGIVSALLFGGGSVILTMFFSMRLAEYLFKSSGWLDVTSLFAWFLFLLQALGAGGWVGWNWAAGSPFIELIKSSAFWRVNVFVTLGIIILCSVFQRL